MAAVELNSTNLINDSSLEAYYRLENVNDTTANARNLTNNNSVAFSAAKFNNGADFGTTVNGTKSLSITSALGITTGVASVSFWVKLATEIAVESGVYVFFSKSSTTNVTYTIQYNYNSGTRRLEFKRTRDGSGEEYVAYTITLGTASWYHLAMTYDGTNIRAYVNGSLVGSPTASSGAGSSGGVDKTYIGANIVPASLTTSTTYSSNNTFVCPAGVTSVDVECWGPGGHGQDGGGSPSGGSNAGGGGGGAYAASTGISVTPGSSYAVTVGTGGSGTATSFNTSTVVAAAGTSGSGGLGGAGGTTAASTGATKFAGGAGGNPGAGPGGPGGGAAGPDGAGGSGNNGGGGAGGAGDNGSGGAGGSASGGTGVSNAKGGGGGGGGANNAGGGNAGSPGGGGGGGEDFGGTGAAGQVKITYTTPTYETLGLIDDVAVFSSALSATTIDGLYNGTLSGPGASGLDSLSTSGAYNAIWRSRIFNLGTDFTLQEIRIPLTNDVDSTTNIELIGYVDDGSSSFAIATINNTNYSGQRYVRIKPLEVDTVTGQNNFVLEARFTGTTEIGFGFPIELTFDTSEST